MKLRNQFVSAAVIVAALCSPGAHACGLVGCLANALVPGAGDKLDELNKNAGQPFDHGVAATLNTIAPGSGAAIEAGWELQRLRDRQNRIEIMRHLVVR